MFDRIFLLMARVPESFFASEWYPRWEAALKREIERDAPRLERTALTARMVKLRRARRRTPDDVREPIEKEPTPGVEPGTLDDGNR